MEAHTQDAVGRTAPDVGWTLKSEEVSGNRKLPLVVGLEQKIRKSRKKFRGSGVTRDGAADLVKIASWIEKYAFAILIVEWVWSSLGTLNNEITPK